MNTKTIPTFMMLICLMINSGCNETRKAPMPENTENKARPEETGKTPASEQKNTASGVFFKGGGNEPFWNVELAETGVTFTSLIEGYEALETPLPEVVRAADANVKRYRAVTEKTELILTIRQDSCADTMADKKYGYLVTLDIKTGEDTGGQSLSGCGDYLMDQRLHDIWVLEQLGEETAKAEWFAKELPSMEINTNDRSFTGYAGCNQMHGKLFSEQSLLRFTQVATTRKACIPGNREGDFLQNLRNVTAWKIENNRLWLSNPDGMQLVFRKAD